MSDVYDEITDEIDGTEYEDADITGRTYDDDSSDYVTYNGSTYYFSWD
jgi:hypothetical protein